jgi:hypothetical protein
LPLFPTSSHDVIHGICKPRVKSAVLLQSLGVRWRNGISLVVTNGQTVIVEIEMIQNNRIEIHFILDWRNWIRPRSTTGKVSKKTIWPTCTWRGMYVAFFWTHLLLVFNFIFSVIWHLRNIIYKSLVLQHVIQCSYKPNQGPSG